MPMLWITTIAVVPELKLDGFRAIGRKSGQGAQHVERVKRAKCSLCSASSSHTAAAGVETWGVK